MKKLMMLAAMLAMVLVAASPAFAQTAVAVSGDFDGDDVEFNAVSQNVFDEIDAVGVQFGNVGDLEAGDDLSQSIAQEQDVSVWVMNDSLNTGF